MSKSLGNFVTIKDFINKYKNINLLKLFFLSAHYSHPIDYNQEKIEETKKQKESLDSFFNTVYILHRGEAEPTISDKDKNKIDSIFSKFEEAMDNDFNTAQALSCLFELRDTALSFSNLKSFEYARTKMKDLFNIFNLSVQPQLELLEEQYEDQYQREKLRQLRDFDSADKIRKRWEELGYILEDHKGATAWRKKE